MKDIIGNCYPYTEDDEDEVFEKVSLIAERRKLQSEMELFARMNNEYEINWDDMEQKKWFLFIDYCNMVVDIDFYNEHREPNGVYFTSREVCLKALDKFGDRMRNLYLDN